MTMGRGLYPDLSRTLKGFFRQFETNFDTSWNKAIDALASTVYLLGVDVNIKDRIVRSKGLSTRSFIVSRRFNSSVLERAKYWKCLHHT